MSIYLRLQVTTFKIEFFWGKVSIFMFFGAFCKSLWNIPNFIKWTHTVKVFETLYLILATCWTVRIRLQLLQYCVCQVKSAKNYQNSKFGSRSGQDVFMLAHSVILNLRKKVTKLLFMIFFDAFNRLRNLKISSSLMTSFKNSNSISLSNFFTTLWWNISVVQNSLNLCTTWVPSIPSSSCSQMGFRNNSGTEEAINRVHVRVTRYLDENTKCLATFQDLSNAFDLVNHDMLIGKIKGTGCKGTVLKWCTSYLQKTRSQNGVFIKWLTYIKWGNTPRICPIVTFIFNSY